jgi:hypothetical protein
MTFWHENLEIKPIGVLTGGLISTFNMVTFLTSQTQPWVVDTAVQMFLAMEEHLSVPWDICCLAFGGFKENLKSSAHPFTTLVGDDVAGEGGDDWL